MTRDEMKELAKDQASESPAALMEVIRIADGQIAELWGVSNWR
jgi:hypothetical protein